MKPVYFVICFTLGVGLMIFSGYLPQAANAVGSGHGKLQTADDGSSAAEEDLWRRRTWSHRVDAEHRYVPSDPSEWVYMDEGEAAAGEEDVDGPDAGMSGVDDGESPAGAGIGDDQPPEQLGGTESWTEPGQEQDPGALTDFGLDEAPDAPETKASAGRDQVAWIGWDELGLDGSGSTGGDLVYRWRQVAGPTQLQIADPNAVKTVASGILSGGYYDWRDVRYEFELKVSDEQGYEDIDRVTYIVSSAPALRVTPPAERRFEVRDGYELGHYEAWISYADSYRSKFEVVSETELLFTKVTGSPYELTGGKQGSRYVYQIEVFGQGDEPTSWVEFLVDTSDGIPGILQLGMYW